MTQLDKNIALNLKRIRKSKNMSLDMLAERTGVSKSMLGQIERGKTNPQSDPDPEPTDEEQSLPGRGTRCWQDRRGGRTGSPDRGGRCAFYGAE